jgi:hypothetical protein
MRLERPGRAPLCGQPAALNACCARQALSPIAQLVQKGDPGFKPAGNLTNVG